ncbi:MAG: PQQ-binding-like beta-propeller repeat protein [Acidobacteriota bacterium]
MRAHLSIRLLVLTFLVSSTSLLAADWPTFLGPDANGRSSESIRLDWPESGPPVLWQHEVGDGYSAPSVMGERVWVFDRVRDRNRLTALDVASGKTLWTASYKTDYEDLYGFSGGPRAVPVIHDRMVYTYGAEGRLRAHDVSTGELVWDVDTTKRYGVVQNFFGVGATPVVDGELLIVMVGGSPPDSPKISSGTVQGNGTGLVAFDRKTGEERWRSSDELASYATPVITEVAGARRGFAFMRGGLLGFDPATGNEQLFFPWRARKLESVNAATPVVVGDLVLLTESYSLGTVVLRIGAPGSEPAVVWRDPRRGKSLESHWMTPIHHDGTVYGSSGESRGNAELRAIELATGTVKWAKKGLGRSTLIYADGHLLVLTETGVLLLVAADPEGYREIARVDLGERLGSPSWNAPVLANGRLFLQGAKRVVVLDLSKPSG